jgi:transcriptional regulator of acetoin/glycerol metabolism
MEREVIRQAVDAAGGNISEASKRLGISRNTIYRKLRWNQGG